MKCCYLVGFLFLFDIVKSQDVSKPYEGDRVVKGIYKYLKEGPNTLCKSKLKQIVGDAKTSVPFFDAIGKPASGILLGNLNWWGSYDLCMQLKTVGLLPCKTSGLVPLSNTTSAMLIWTSCLPSDCRNDFIDVFINILDESITPLVDKYVPIGKYPIVHKITGILGWKPVERDTLIEYDLETIPLRIKTNSTRLSNDTLMVNFYDELEDLSGYFAVSFKTTLKYKIGNCGDYKLFPVSPPVAKDRVWNITKTEKPGLKVVCNDVTVLDVALSDGVCTEYTGNWSTLWTKKVTQIEFPTADTASDKYYVKPEYTLKTTCQDPISYDAGAYIGTVFCIFFITLTTLGSVRGPLKKYISWFVKEVQCGEAGDNEPEVAYNKKRSVVVKENTEEINIVIGNKTADDANILLDVQASCQKEADEDDTRAGFEVTENLYDTGVDPEDTASEGHEPLVGVRNALYRFYPSARSSHVVLDKISETSVSVLKCFSLQRNIQILMDTTVKPGQVLCMNGIRSLSIGWVLLSHMFLVPLLASQGDAYQAFVKGKRRSFDIILNGFPSVDSFFVMSGFLVSFLLIKNFEKGKTFRGIAVGYYVHRYIRLTIPYLMVILIQGFLYRQYITGPFADNFTLGYEGCKKWWWANLLYINNFLPWSSPAKCVGQSWYLANDMQFFIVAPLFIWLLWKSPVLGNLVLWVTVLVSMLAAGVATWYYKFATSPLRAGVSGKEFQYYYTKPYFRFIPYLVGIFGGWLYHKYAKRMEQLAKMKPLTKLVLSVQLWAVTIAIEYAVIFGTHNDAGIAPTVESPGVTIPYAIFGRVGWAGALLTQIFLCQAGLGGPINDFLSWRGWLPLSRLTYSVYLLHYGINIAWVAQLRHVYSYSPDFQSVVIFLGLIATVNFCGVLLFLFVEQPSANLEKLLLPAPRPPRNVATNIPDQKRNIPEHSDQVEQKMEVPEELGEIPDHNSHGDVVQTAEEKLEIPD